MVLIGLFGSSGDPFLRVLLALFGLAGLLILFVGGVFPRLPQPVVLVRNKSVHAGEALELRWSIESGRFIEARGIHLSWQGREQVVIRGYGNQFKQAIFLRQSLGSGGDPVAGAAVVAIPAEVMPSFASKNAGIIWLIRAELDGPRWLGLAREFEVEVRPARTERS